MQTDTSTMPTVIETEHDGGFPLDSPTEVFRVALDRRENNRKALLSWIAKNLIEGTDFGRIHVFSRNKCPKGNDCQNPRHWSKPSLWKAGAEKICGMLGLVARFPSQEHYERAAYTGAELRQVIIRCQLVSPSGVVVGEGMGGRSVSQDKGDLNKTIKMAQKSAHVDATLRTAGLSEIFTQDLEGLLPRDLDPDDSGLPQGMSSTRETVEQKMEQLRKQKEERMKIKENQKKMIMDFLDSPLFSDEERKKGREFCDNPNKTKDQAANFIGSLKKHYRNRKKVAAQSQQTSDEQNGGPDTTDPGPDPDEEAAANQGQQNSDKQTDNQDTNSSADEPDATEPGPDPNEKAAADSEQADAQDAGSEDEDLEERKKEVMDNLEIPEEGRAEFLKWAGRQTALSGAALLDDLEKNSDMYLTAWEQD